MINYLEIIAISATSLLYVLTLTQTILNLRTMDLHSKILLSNISSEEGEKVVIVSPCIVRKMSRSDIEAFLNTLRQLSSHDKVEKIIIVVDDEDDLRVLEKESFGKIIFGEKTIARISDKNICRECSGKNRAIATALRDLEIFSRDTTVILLDCDADFIHLRNQLGTLSETIKRRSNTLITSYRWYTLQNLCSVLYNVISAMFFDVLLSYRTRIVWGGFMVFSLGKAFEYRVSEELLNEIADDATIRRVFSRNRADILFCPMCLGFTDLKCESGWFKEFISWATRQFLMIRIYTPRGFKYVLIGYITLAILMLLPLPTLIFSIELSLRTLYIITIPMILLGIVKTLLLINKLSHYYPRNLIYRGSAWFLLYIIISSIRSLIATPLLLKTRFIKEFEWRGQAYCIEKINDLIKAVPC
ncbi:MAG: hypothetical protein ACP5GI_01620 [Sulfolobales archaeon]